MKIISVIGSDKKLLQRGILLLSNVSSYVVYTPGVITEWFMFLSTYTLSDSGSGSRRVFPKIPEFDKYLESHKESDEVIHSDLSEYSFDTFNRPTKRDPVWVNFKDRSGIKLSGVYLSWLNLSHLKYTSVIYDGIKISKWDIKSNENDPGCPEIVEEVDNFFIGNNPDLDKYIKPIKFDQVELIKPLPIDQEKIKELEKVMDKNRLSYKIEELTEYLVRDKFLEDLLRLIETTGDTKSAKIVYDLIELIK